MPAMNIELSQRACAWTRYWSSGAMHSCAGSYDAAYAGPIGDFWRAGFTGLAQGARVLDVASGNGPLPRLLLSLEARPDLRCDAIDLADVAPRWLNDLAGAARARVRFHSACAAEALPFPADSFDLVVSQWGLEYSDLSRSIPELLRVLAPGGGVQLLLHHAQALPVRLAAEEIAHLAWLTQADGFMQRAADLIGPMALAGTPEGRSQLKRNERANEARERFNTQQDLLETRMEQGGCVDVLADMRRNVNGLFGMATQRGESAALAVWQALNTGLYDARLRLQELRGHALDESAATALAHRLAAGGSYQLAPLSDRGELMGWTLRLTPRP